MLKLGKKYKMLLGMTIQMVTTQHLLTMYTMFTYFEVITGTLAQLLPVSMVKYH